MSIYPFTSASASKKAVYNSKFKAPRAAKDSCTLQMAKWPAKRKHVYFSFLLQIQQLH